MFYLKTDVDGELREIEIYDDEIFTRCFNCGKEIQVDTETIKLVLEHEGDFSSTSLSCGCNTERPKLILVK